MPVGHNRGQLADVAGILGAGAVVLTILDQDGQAFADEELVVENDEAEGQGEDVVAGADLEKVANVFLCSREQAVKSQRQETERTAPRHASSLPGPAIGPCLGGSGIWLSRALCDCRTAGVGMTMARQRVAPDHVLQVREEAPAA